MFTFFFWRAGASTMDPEGAGSGQTNLIAHFLHKKKFKNKTEA